MVAHCAQPTNEVKGARGSITPTLHLAWAAKGDAGHHGIRATLPHPPRKKKKEIKCHRSQQAYFTQLLILLW